MVRVLAVGAALWLLACNPAGATRAVYTPASLSRGEAAQLVLRADDARRLALESSGSDALSEVFAHAALQRIQAESKSLGMRGVREEERPSSRELIFWDLVASEAVLQIAAERRLVTRDQPDPAWSPTVRQWWARLRNVGGGWKVVDQEDLPPDRWRPAVAESLGILL